MLFRRDDNVKRRLCILLDIMILLLLLVLTGVILRWFFPMLKDLAGLLPELLLPFLLALAAAVLLEPCVNFFELRCYMRRTSAVFFSLLLSVGTVVLAFILIVSVMASQLMELSRMFAAGSESGAAKLFEVFSQIWSGITGTVSSPGLQEEVQNLFKQNLDTCKTILTQTVGILTGVLTMLPQILLFMAVMGIACFFILKDRYLIRTFILGLLPQKTRIRVRHIFGQLLFAFMRFMRAYGSLIFCTMVLTMAGLWLLRIPFAFSAGILAGILDIMPVIGPGILFLPWSVTALILGNTRVAVSVLSVYVLTSVVRNILEPKILGSSIGLHPLVSLMAIYVGLKLAGIWGMIFLPMVLVIIITLFRIGVFRRPGFQDGEE